MRTAWKLLAGFGVVLTLLLAGVFIAISSIDVDTWLGPIKDRVKAATGRELTVRGGARLALSLTPRLVLSEVALANAPWAQAREMLTARQLQLEVELLPLLSRRFELTEVNIVDPVIALERDASGRGNWETAPVRTPTSASSGVAEGGGGFGVGNVSITNGTLTYRDGASGKVTNVLIERMFLRARDAKGPIAAQFRGKIDDVPVVVEGTLGPLEQLLAQRWPYSVSLQGEVAGQGASASTSLRAEKAKITFEDLKVKFGPDAVAGSFAVATDGPRPKLMFALTGSAPALKALPLPMAPPAASGPERAAPARIFGDTPIDFAPLRAVDAEGSIAFDKLIAPGGAVLTAVRARLTLVEGRLSLREMSAAHWGGTIGGTLSVDAHDPAAVRLVVALEGRELDLGALLAAAGVPREVRGGKTRIDIDLALAGASPHAWASSATGSVLASVGRASLPQTRVDFGPTLQSIADSVNPFRKSDPITELECAVARLPMSKGVARIDHSLAIETGKLGATASGTLDFSRETLDLAIQPKVRKGISLNIPQLAELVRVVGPFASPQVKVDAAGSVKALASIGAAIGTGGLSVVGQTLFAWTEGDGPGPCAIAADARTAAAAPAPQPGAGNPVVNEIGRTMNRLFGR